MIKYYIKEQLENNDINISKIFDDHIHFNKYGHKIVLIQFKIFKRKL